MVTVPLVPSLRIIFKMVPIAIMATTTSILVGNLWRMIYSIVDMVVVVSSIRTTGLDNRSTNCCYRSLFPPCVSWPLLRPVSWVVVRPRSSLLGVSPSLCSICLVAYSHVRTVEFFTRKQKDLHTGLSYMSSPPTLGGGLLGVSYYPVAPPSVPSNKGCYRSRGGYSA